LNLGQEIDYPDWDFSPFFVCPSRKMLSWYLKIGCDLYPLTFFLIYISVILPLRIYITSVVESCYLTTLFQKRKLHIDRD